MSIGLEKAREQHNARRPVAEWQCWGELTPVRSMRNMTCPECGGEMHHDYFDGNRNAPILECGTCKYGEAVNQ